MDDQGSPLFELKISLAITKLLFATTSSIDVKKEKEREREKKLIWSLYNSLYSVIIAFIYAFPFEYLNLS